MTLLGLVQLFKAVCCLRCTAGSENTLSCGKKYSLYCGKKCIQWLPL